MGQPLRIRAGTVRDVKTIYAMLRGLARYERLLRKFQSSAARVRRDGFGPRRSFYSLICLRGRRPVGIAVYFFTYSTFAARPTLYVEDVFVWPRHRGQGAGTALLATLARIAVRKGCGRMEWTVLNWNTAAIRFYERLGATMRREWVLTRLAGEPLRRLARAARR
jgi:GNAT superfamily N-acetyltransferase